MIILDGLKETNALHVFMQVALLLKDDSEWKELSQIPLVDFSSGSHFTIYLKLRFFIWSTARIFIFFFSFFFINFWTSRESVAILRLIMRLLVIAFFRLVFILISKISLNGVWSVCLTLTSVFSITRNFFLRWFHRKRVWTESDC